METHNAKPELDPLCQKSDLLVYRPSLDFFVEKIRKNEYFSYTKQLHGFWDAVIAAWIVNPDLRKIDLQNKHYLQRLTEEMSRAKYSMEGLYYEPKFYYELIKILNGLDGNDPSFMFGVSDTYFHPISPPPYSIFHFATPHKCVFKQLHTKDSLNYFKVKFKDRQAVIKQLLPSAIPLYDGLVWKFYAYENKIQKLFDAIREHPVVLVGAAHFKNFDKLTSLQNFRHIEINGSHASVDRAETLKKIISIHKDLSEDNRPPIYFFVAGSVSVYWIYHLHQMLQNKFLIDAGQAFNFLLKSNKGLKNREFGYSQKPGKGRYIYKSDHLYGKRDFHSHMHIENNQVRFDFKLKFSAYRLEWLKGTINRYLVSIVTIRSLRLKIKHLFYRSIPFG